MINLENEKTKFSNFIPFLKNFEISLTNQQKIEIENELKKQV